MHRTNAVLTAPPGAGKTTVVPLVLLEEPWLDRRRIVMLQPRRLAARAAASWMASVLGETVGETVGYRTRFDTKVGVNTRVEVVTEGILTRLLQHDPSLGSYGLVIFDEFHERSLHADLALALALDSQRVFRPDLRILVMSATLDVGPASDLLGGAPVVASEGRQFPIETHYLKQPLTIPVDQAVAEMVRRVLAQESGSVLVFLPGMGEIRRVERRLRESRLPADVVVAVLHGDLPQQAQDRAIMPAPTGQRKVVLASSIAETSLTIEGVRIVIDSGLRRVPRFDPRSGLTRLETMRVTQDSAEQRCGRAGRVEPGVCYRLWSAGEQKTLLRRRTPEILEADLAPLMLDLAVWGVRDPGELRWLDTPPPGAVAQAMDLLTRLGAVDRQGKVTRHGEQMAELPLHPRLAHMVLRAVELGAGETACEVAALLEERDVLRSETGRPNPDFRLRMETLRRKASAEAELTLDRVALRRAEQAARHVRRLVERVAPIQGRATQSEHRPIGLDRLGLVLAFAYPDRIAQRQPGGDGRYRLANGRGARLQGHHALSDEPFLVVAELEDSPEWARIDLAAPVDQQDLEEFFADHIRTEEFVAWDRETKMVLTRRQERLGALILRDQPLARPDPAEVTAALLDGIRQAGIASLPWTRELRQWQARVEFLRRMEGPGTTWPDVSDATLLSGLDQWLAPFLTGVTRLDQVQRLDLSAPLHALLTWEQQQALDRLAPSHVTVPSGSRRRLEYEGQEQPVLSVRLQEMFGCTDTPRVANGKVPVMIHLLSPAGRPVQVTQDLTSFWAKAYHDVRKDLRGRYPKHHWPEDPLEANPTRKAKSRRS